MSRNDQGTLAECNHKLTIPSTDDESMRFKSHFQMFLCFSKSYERRIDAINERQILRQCDSIQTNSMQDIVAWVNNSKSSSIPPPSINSLLFHKLLQAFIPVEKLCSNCWDEVGINSCYSRMLLSLQTGKRLNLCWINRLQFRIDNNTEANSAVWKDQ